MPSPEVRYCTTEDGVRIAVWMLGEGPPLVMTPGWWTLASTTYEREDGRVWLDQLARSWRVVRYDNRGTGESQRDATNSPLEARVRDLEGVVDELALERFVLLGYLGSGPASIAYTCRHPDRVSHLMLWCTTARGSDTLPGGGAATVLAQGDWQTYLDSAALRGFGWSSAAAGRRGLEEFQSTLPQDTGTQYVAELASQDTTPLLPDVRVPTLVLQRRQATRPDVTEARAVASQIPGAKFVILEGDSAVASVGDVDAVLREIAAFTGVGATTSASSAASGLRTILFTDLTSSTALTQRLGDAKAQELVRAHNAIVREALAAQGGTEIKHTGDGIMASFPTASGALECAVAIQRGVALHADGDLQVHIGLNAGEPVAEESDLFGTSVQLARRICDHASSGQILVSNVVRELSAGKGFLFADIGEVVPKGFEEPVRLYEVRWSD